MHTVFIFWRCEYTKMANLTKLFEQSDAASAAGLEGLGSLSKSKPAALAQVANPSRDVRDAKKATRANKLISEYNAGYVGDLLPQDIAADKQEEFYSRIGVAEAVRDQGLIAERYAGLVGEDGRAGHNPQYASALKKVNALKAAGAQAWLTYKSTLEEMKQASSHFKKLMAVIQEVFPDSVARMQAEQTEHLRKMAAGGGLSSGSKRGGGRRRKARM